MKAFKSHVLAKFLVGIFLLAGVAFRTTHFVADAATRTLSGGTATWNNLTNFLDSTFWNGNPSSGDIVKALYGSGDEGSIYTTNWSGYTSGSCLSGGMTVEFTGVLPTTLSSHTIYVITSGTYNVVTTGITMDDCSALISSGTVILSGHASNQPIIDITGGKNIIIDHITIDGKNGTGDGIYFSGSNATLHNISSYNNYNGINFSSGSYTTIINATIFSNSGLGISLSSAYQNIIVQSTINTNTLGGITIDGGYGNIVSGCTLSGNGNRGIKFLATSENIINNVHSLVPNSRNHSLRIYGGTGNRFSLFSGNNSIYGEIISGQNNSDVDATNDIFDMYTVTNNTIDFIFSPYAKLTGNTILSGSQFYLDFDNIHIYSDPTDIYGPHNLLTLSGVTSFTISGADRNGILYAPMEITAGIKQGNQGETGLNFISPVLYTMEVGSSGSILLVSGGSTTITYILSGEVRNQYVKIYTSTDGNTRTPNTSTSGCILDDDLLCSFSTTGYLKLFAFYTPVSFSFTGITQSGDIVTTGPYYNTGVYIYFTGDSLSGITLNGSAYTSGTLITGDGVKVFALTDMEGNTTGITFTIDTTNPLVTGNTPTSGQTITSSINTTFTWSGSDTTMSGYTLYISGTSYPETGATTYTVNNMYNGTYIWYVIARDKAGNTGMSIPMSFTLNVPLTGRIFFSGAVTSGNLPYTKNPAGLIFRANKTADFSITGDITVGTLTGTTSLSTTGPISSISLSGTDGSKIIYVTLSTGSESTSGTQQIFLDTTAPSIVTLTVPASGATIGDAITLAWSASTDTGVGLSGYRYYLSTSSVFTTITTSGYTTATGVTISAGTINSGTYYRYIQSIDKLGRSGDSIASNFYYSGTLDTTPNSFTFDKKTNAKLDKEYMSSTETIGGLTAGISVLATVTKGSLYINDNRTGTHGYVKNGDTVNIEMLSSDDYATSVSSTLTIGSFSTAFKITTKDDTSDNSDDEDTHDTDLSDVVQLQMSIIFNTLVNLYPEGNSRTVFLQTLLTQLESRINNLEDDNEDQDTIDALQYLYDLIDDELGGGSIYTYTTTPSSDRYVAPNGKVYAISYNSTTKLYTSPDFMFPKTFTTLDAMKSYIDVNNGGGGSSLGTASGKGWNHTVDTSWQASPYTAPNGKVYSFFKTTDNRYASYNFISAKYFDSPQSMIMYININNPR